MACRNSSRDQKKASEEGATLIFLDESCFQLFPVRKRTLAPRGKTPLLPAWDRRGKISAIGAVAISRKAQRHSLIFRLLPPEQNFTGELVIDFLRKIRKRIPGPIKLIWDGAGIHRSRLVKAFLTKSKTLETYRFPAYAPDTNPVEGCWAHAKYHQLPNLQVSSVTELAVCAEATLNEIASRPDLLESFVRHALEE